MATLPAARRPAQGPPAAFERAAGLCRRRPMVVALTAPRRSLPALLTCEGHEAG